MSKTLDDALKALNKVQWVSAQIGNKWFEKINTLSTWVLGLDVALWGWLAEGRIVEIFGGESSGKTTITLHAIAQAQKEGKVCAFIDMEHAVDFDYAVNLWVDKDALIYVQPDNGEAAIEAAKILLETWDIDLMIVDSVAQMLPKAEADWEIWAANVWRHARLMNQAMRILTPLASKNKTTVVFINQIRMMIGQMFGNPETTPGGTGLKYACSQRIRITRKESESGQLKEGKDNIGSQVTVTVIKNKIAPPFKKSFLNIMYGTGVHVVSDVLAVAKDLGIYEGRWKVNWVSVWSNDADVVRYYIDNPEELDSLKDVVMNSL